MFVVAIIAGLVGSMVGVGGGILVVPALTIGFGIPIEYAIGASIISTIATSSASASAYVRDGITNLRIGMFLEIASVLGSIVGVIATLYFVRSGLSWTIFIVFGLLLFFSAYNVVQNARIERAGESRVNTKPNRIAERLNLRGEYEDRSLHTTIEYVATRVPTGFGIIFFAPPPSSQHYRRCAKQSTAFDRDDLDGQPARRSPGAHISVTNPTEGSLAVLLRPSALASMP